MEIRYYKHYSSHLNRDMEFKVYGHAGKPVLFIPCQGGRFFDFENFKMIDHWAGWIEAGRCTVYACDCIDNESWAAKGADNRWRIENHERWFNYITQELVPYIKHLSGERNGYDQGILTFGASMGAMHAANAEALISTAHLLMTKRVNLAMRIVPGGNHSEASWEKQIPIFMDCLGL